MCRLMHCSLKNCSNLLYFDSFWIDDPEFNKVFLAASPRPWAQTTEQWFEEIRYQSLPGQQMLTYVLHNGVSSFPEQIKAKCSTYGNIKMSKDSFMQIQPEAVIFLQSFSTNVAHLKHRVDELFFNPTWIWLDTNIWRPKSRWLVL